MEAAYAENYETTHAGSVGTTAAIKRDAAAVYGQGRNVAGPQAGVMTASSSEIHESSTAEAT